MANTVTKAERAKIQATANRITRIDHNQCIVEWAQTVQNLMVEYNISRQRAESYIAKAARLKRYSRR